MKLTQFQKDLITAITHNMNIPIRLGQTQIIRFFGPKAQNVAGAHHDGHIIDECIFWAPEVHPEQATSILFHELTHATMVPGRLNRSSEIPPCKMFFDKSYNMEEVVAETTAQMLMKFFNKDNDFTNNFSEIYIEQYSSDLTNKEQIWCDDKAKEAFNYLITNVLGSMIRNERKAS